MTLSALLQDAFSALLSLRCSLSAQKLVFSERTLQCAIKIVVYRCKWPIAKPIVGPSEKAASAT
jgi:hypothetical protein